MDQNKSQQQGTDRQQQDQKSGQQQNEKGMNQGNQFGQPNRGGDQRPTPGNPSHDRNDDDEVNPDRNQADSDQNKGRQQGPA